VRFNQPVRRVRYALAGLRTVVGTPNLRRVQLAWGAVIAADWAQFVALGVFAFQAGGTTAVGIAGLVRMLPGAVLAPFAASLGDRFRREAFLRMTTSLGTAALAGSAAAFYAGRNEAAVFALAALFGASTTLFRPAHQALLPSLARSPTELIAANGASSTIESLGTMSGPLAAAVLVSVGSAGVVFAVAAVLLLAATVLLSRVHVEGRLRPALENAPFNAARALMEGLRHVVRSPRPRLVMGLMVAQSFVRGCLNVLIVIAAFDVLDAGAGAVGFLTAALGAGGLLGAFGAVSLEGRRLAIPFGVALIGWGAPIALVAPTPYLAVGLVLLGIVGAANSVEDVAGLTLLQRIVPDAVLTRAFGLLFGFAMAAVGLGSIAATGLVALVGARPSFVIIGALLPLLTLLSWRRLAAIDRAVYVRTAELGLISRVPMFEPLSVAAKEHLAGSLLPVEIRAGDRVIGAGEAGDRFYIVRNGELAIDGNGFHASARAGDHFGEIALLRDVPRTASVTAVVDSRLYALEREAFLAAVTGHRGALAAGEAVATERLAAG
jgi:MFS family permease